MALEENKALVRRFIEELFGQGNMALADELLSAEAAEVYRAWAANVRGGLPDLRATVEYLVAEGDLVAAFWVWEGTHTGVAIGPYVDLLVPSGCIEPTGKRITMSGCFLFRVAGGKLTRLRLDGDLLHLFQQYGVLPTVRAADRMPAGDASGVSATARIASPDTP